MIKSLAAINNLLIDIKTINRSLLVKLQHAGFNTDLAIGLEDEYSIKSLISSIDSLTIQLLTITAKRNQFISRTSFTERKDIEIQLKYLFMCLKETQNTLELFNLNRYQVVNNKPLCFVSDSGARSQLALLNAVEYIDALKPYYRMLELVIAHERIHALSAVLESLLNKSTTPPSAHNLENDGELTGEQDDALEISHYLVKQAL